MNYDRNNEIEIHKTPIQKFYAEQSISITVEGLYLHKYLCEKTCQTRRQRIISQDIWICNNIKAMWDRLSKEDRQIFNFNMIVFDWIKYLTDCYKGMRLYLFNEDDSSLENSRIKYRRLCWLHRILETVLLFVIFLIIWSIFVKIFA